MAEAAANQPEELKTEQEIIQRYQHLKNQQNQLMNRIAEVESQQHEHALVLETIKPLDGNRKSHRLIGSVLVEKPLSEVVPEIEATVANLNTTIKSFNDALTKVSTELEAHITKYKIRAAGQGGQQQAAQQQQQAKSDDARGVLA